MIMWLFFQRFFDYALLRPMSYALIFRRMKDFMKMYSLGSFN